VLLAGFVDVFRVFAAVNHLRQLPNQIAAVARYDQSAVAVTPARKSLMND